MDCRPQHIIILTEIVIELSTSFPCSRSLEHSAFGAPFTSVEYWASKFIEPPLGTCALNHIVEVEHDSSQSFDDPDDALASAMIIL